MERGTGTVEKKGRYFDPYTGADLVLRMRILELEQEQQEEGGRDSHTAVYFISGDVKFGDVDRVRS